MNAQELFDKHTNTWMAHFHYKVMKEDQFIAALAEALEGGHLQPVVSQSGDGGKGGTSSGGGDDCYYQLTAQLLHIRNEAFAGAGMDKDCFTETYLNGLGEYEREVARKEGIDIGW